MATFMTPIVNYKTLLRGTFIWDLYAHVKSHLITLSPVQIGTMRCQQKPFSAVLGFAGEPIEVFPAYRFFCEYLDNPNSAVVSFTRWMRWALIDLEAWKVPQREGGWANGSLVKLIRHSHQANGIKISTLDEAEPNLVNRAIEHRVLAYFDLMESIHTKGFRLYSYPPIACQQEEGVYYICNGHHRLAILRALGLKTAYAQVKST